MGRYSAISGTAGTPGHGTRRGMTLWALLVAGLGFGSAAGARAEDALWQALAGGKFDLLMNYRYEHFDDDLRPEPGDASTLRTTLGYATGQFHGFLLRGLVQDVSQVIEDDFDDGTLRPESKTQYAVIPDPSDTDFIEAYLGYQGLLDTTFKLGRQIVTFRDAPFHRFIGNVLWRQNWMNHDAFSAQNRSLQNTVIDYVYSWNVNRIFTDEAAVSSMANFRSDSHLVNVQYTGIPFGKVEGYAYLLDLENSPGNSTQTYGARFAGARELTTAWKALYAVEYAHETDYAGNPGHISADYVLAEAGAAVTLGGPVASVSVKFSYELLGGDGGTDRFITPLATGHAFQGWADRFLDTPQDGIEDYYWTMLAQVWDAKFTFEYHDLNSDNLDYDYGEEFNLMLTRTFREHYTFGLKYALYEADRNAENLLRNGPASLSPRVTVVNDAARVWAWATIKF
ncbi:MAG: hypothetical protein HYR49_01875 [Gammaproteobacteria bacterium]|nr:hypothetical protein [Gammaproteobacteria bacterium]